MAPTPAELDRTCEQLGKLTDKTLKEQYDPIGIGFATLVFHLGVGGSGYLACLSNTPLAALIEALQKAVSILQETQASNAQEQRL